MRNQLKEKENLTKEEIYAIIKSYIEEEMELSNRKMRDETNFTLASWPEFQAFHLGKLKAFNQLLNFIP